MIYSLYSETDQLPVATLAFGSSVKFVLQP